MTRDWKIGYNSYRMSPKLLSEESKKPKSNTALEKFEAKWKENKFVCVGLDPEIEKLPEVSINKKDRGEAIFEFNKEIIDATADLALCYKPNSAFYEGEGIAGLTALENTIEYIKEKDDSIPIILDAKRGDIGNTNRGYTKFVFDFLGTDATTVQPYQGGSILEAGERSSEALAPFFERKDKLIFVLCRTSNPSAGELQDLPISLKSVSREYIRGFGDIGEIREITGKDVVPLYQIVAFIAVRSWNRNGNLGLVVGATYPDELAQVRKIAPDVPILIPGIGPQKGYLEQTIKAGLNSNRQRIIMNSSRGIIYSSNKADFAQAARAATLKLNDQIKKAI